MEDQSEWLTGGDDGTATQKVLLLDYSKVEGTRTQPHDAAGLKSRGTRRVIYS